MMLGFHIISLPGHATAGSGDVHGLVPSGRESRSIPFCSMYAIARVQGWFDMLMLAASIMDAKGSFANLKDLESTCYYLEKIAVCSTILWKVHSW